MPERTSTGAVAVTSEPLKSLVAVPTTITTSPASTLKVAVPPPGVDGTPPPPAIAAGVLRELDRHVRPVLRAGDREVGREGERRTAAGAVAHRLGPRGRTGDAVVRRHRRRGQEERSVVGVREALHRAEAVLLAVGRPILPRRAALGRVFDGVELIDGYRKARREVIRAAFRVDGRGLGERRTSVVRFVRHPRRRLQLVDPGQVDLAEPVGGHGRLRDHRATALDGDHRRAVLGVRDDHGEVEDGISNT